MASWTGRSIIVYPKSVFSICIEVEDFTWNKAMIQKISKQFYCIILDFFGVKMRISSDLGKNFSERKGTTWL